MSVKVILTAMAAACLAASHSFRDAAVEQDTGGGEAPPPRAAVRPGAAAAAKGKPAKGKKAAPEISYEDLKAKMTTIIKDLGKEKAIACLQRYGIEKLPELAEDSYIEFDAFLDQVIAGDLDPEEQGSTDDLLG